MRHGRRSLFHRHSVARAHGLLGGVAKGPDLRDRHRRYRHDCRPYGALSENAGQRGVARAGQALFRSGRRQLPCDQGFARDVHLLEPQFDPRPAFLPPRPGLLPQLADLSEAWASGAGSFRCSIMLSGPEAISSSGFPRILHDILTCFFRSTRRTVSSDAAIWPRDPLFRSGSASRTLVEEVPPRSLAIV